MFLALDEGDEPVSPREMAERLKLSPTYLSKINQRLVHVNILRAHQGAHGGVSLRRDPKDITLLEILEACQGQMLANYCEGNLVLESVCAFHHAMHDLHLAVTESLSRWSLADLAARPGPLVTSGDLPVCTLHGVRPESARGEGAP